MGGVFNDRINRFMVSDFEPVRRILTSHEQFGSEKGQVEHAAVFGGPTMEFYDGPHHDRIRAIWSDDFKPRTLAHLRPLITDIVRRRLAPALEELRSGATIELPAQLTRGIPTEVIAHMLDVAPDMVDELSQWSDAMGASAEGSSIPGPHGAELIVAGRRATAELHDYIRKQPGHARARNGASTDLISTMVRHEYACSHMTEQEIVASITQLVFAGNETTAKLLAQSVATLAAHPDQRRAIHADRSLIPAAIEEVHRYETISHSIFRDVVGENQTVSESAQVRANLCQVAPDIHGSGRRVASTLSAR